MVWEAEWRKAVIRQCMEEVRHQVEAKTMCAFELFALRGWPVDKVAEHLGMSPNAVILAKRRVLSRMRELQHQLEEVW